MADPLASLVDLTDRLGRDLTDAETSRAPALLTDASAKVRAFCRQGFTLVTDDVVVLRPVGTILRLPQRPVVDVTAVEAMPGLEGVAPVALAGWTFDGISTVDVHGIGTLVLNLPEWWYDLEGAVNTYRVTYSHGWAEVPELVVAKVCELVNRVLVAPSPVEGMVSERIGAYSYTLQQGAGAPGPGIRLTPDDKRELIDAGYRRGVASTIQVTGR